MGSPGLVTHYTTQKLLILEGKGTAFEDAAKAPHYR